MLEFLKENGVTVLTLVILGVCMFLAVRKMVKDKKNGVGPCGQRCSECEKMQNGECSGKEQ